MARVELTLARTVAPIPVWDREQFHYKDAAAGVPDVEARDYTRNRMGMPGDINARRYYRVAFQRLDDGNALLKIDRPRAAIYLTGYAVECVLKELLLVSTPAGQRVELLATFRNAIAHNIDWLRDRLVQRIGRLPVNESRHVSLVSSWSTDLRYEPGPGDRDDAEAFLSSADAILKWLTEGCEIGHNHSRRRRRAGAGA